VAESGRLPPGLAGAWGIAVRGRMGGRAAVDAAGDEGTTFVRSLGE